MKTFCEWKTGKNDKTITVTCRDSENTLEKLLNYIKGIGNTGHSFAIIVDPGEGEKKFHWDGDGSDSIREIKVT
jgi:hypothetical protein